MHSELEKLIELAIADGVITEKEKLVILKKTEKLGEDPDEIEMILDGKLHQLEANKPRQKEKVGNINTCPACGESVKSFELNCKACGHEFRNIKNHYSSMSVLLSKLDEIDNNVYKTGYEDGKYQSLHEPTLKRIRADKKVNLISNYPIPISKEDLYEFIIFSKSKLDIGLIDDELTKEWRKNMLKLLGKLCCLFQKNPMSIWKFCNSKKIFQFQIKNKRED